MPIFNCPLCKQEVSRAIYEEITGIWDEKEKKLAALRKKEKQLAKKARELQAKFSKEKQDLVKTYQTDLKNQLQKQEDSFSKTLKREKNKIDAEKKKIRVQFDRKLLAVSNKVIKEERAKHSTNLKVIKEQIKRSSELKIKKEKSKIHKEKQRFEKDQRLQMDRNLKLLKQYQTLQTKSQKQLENSDKKIKSLEEQIKKNQSPQMLGLLNEVEFLMELKKEFPGDAFEHTGKGGDILHFVISKERRVGILVYELKKVAQFSNAHISQTRKAKQKREADYGLLVTNAKRKKTDTGFSISQGIIIIHPTGALVLISILRDNLIALSKLRLSKRERSKTIKAVLEYIQSPSFKNALEDIMEDTTGLYVNMKKEVSEHIRRWKYQLDKYRRIYGNAHKIESKAVGLLLARKEKKVISTSEEISPIPLPKNIE